MEIGNVSPSKLKKLGLCEARAVGQIEDEIYDDTKHEGTLAGTLAHNAAKHWFRPSEEWVKATDAVADPNERYRAKQTRVFGSVDKHPIKDLHVAFQMAIKEVAGDQELPKEAQSVMDAKVLFEAIVSTFRRDQINVVFCERRYKGPLTTGVPVHLIVDMGIDRGNGQLDIVDFKTGFLTIDDDECWGDHQVLLNLLVINRDPSLAHFVSKSFYFYWVRKQYNSQPVTLNATQLADYEYWLMFEYQRILGLEKANAKESINRFCNTCYRRLECGEYRKLITEALGQFTPMTVEEMKALDINTVMEKVERAQSQVKALKDFEGQLKDELDARLTSGNTREIEGQRLKVRRRQMKLGGFDSAVILAMCAQYKVDPAALLTPKKNECRSAFENHPEALQQLAATERVGFSSSWIEVLPRGKAAKKETADAAGQG